MNDICPTNEIRPTSDAAYRPSRRWYLWTLSAFLGACCLLQTSDLQSEFISIYHLGPQRLLAETCRVPMLAAPEIKVLSHDIAKRFHVAESAAVTITSAAFRAAHDNGIDPTLVLAIAAVESKFKPHAVNKVTGATGLMQVMAKWHPEKVGGVGGEPSLMLISPNIHVGAAIIAEYLDAEDGDLEGALTHYLGTAGADHYVKQVHSEMAHLTRLRTAI